MSGISRISKRHAEEKEKMPSSSGLELWLRDGDTAYVSIISTGDDEKDLHLDDFFVHTENYTRDDGSRGFKSIFCEKSLDDNVACQFNHEESGGRPSHQFGLWCFVHYVLHSSNNSEAEWKAIEYPVSSGIMKYREDVKDFRIFARGFGRAEQLWNQLVGVHAENQGLDKFVTRIWRTGSSMQDTFFGIASTTSKVETPEDAKAQISSLLSIKEFFRNKMAVSATTDDTTTEPVGETFDDGVPTDPSKQVLEADKVSPEQDASETDEIDGMFKDDSLF